MRPITPKRPGDISPPIPFPPGWATDGPADCLFTRVGSRPLKTVGVKRHTARSEYTHDTPYMTPYTRHGAPGVRFLGARPPALKQARCKHLQAQALACKRSSKYTFSPKQANKLRSRNITSTLLCCSRISTQHAPQTANL